MINVDDLILDYVYDLRKKISSLMTPSVSLNQPDHGLSKEELLSKLIELNYSGYICFFNNLEVIKNPSINASELKESWYVSLTEKGGARWESAFKPNWERYFCIESIPSSSKVDKVTIESGSIQTLEDILQNSHLSFTAAADILEVVPWNPTYWKSIDKGFTVTFELPEDPFEELIMRASKIKWKNKAG